MMQTIKVKSSAAAIRIDKEPIVSIICNLCQVPLQHSLQAFVTIFCICIHFHCVPHVSSWPTDCQNYPRCDSLWLTLTHFIFLSLFLFLYILRIHTLSMTFIFTSSPAVNYVLCCVSALLPNTPLSCLLCSGPTFCLLGSHWSLSPKTHHRRNSRFD